MPESFLDLPYRMPVHKAYTHATHRLYACAAKLLRSQPPLRSPRSQPVRRVQGYSRQSTTGRKHIRKDAMLTATDDRDNEFETDDNGISIYDFDG